MYNDKVIDHFTNPRNVGEMPEPDIVGESGSFKCGDTMKIYLKVEKDKIVDVKFQTFGCGAAIASSSMLTEMVKGKTLEEAERVTDLLTMTTRTERLASARAETESEAGGSTGR